MESIELLGSGPIKGNPKLTLIKDKALAAVRLYMKRVA
jgi:hypothetical protein